jgi:hypothetical protein
VVARLSGSDNGRYRSQNLFFSDPFASMTMNTPSSFSPTSWFLHPLPVFSTIFKVAVLAPFPCFQSRNCALAVSILRNSRSS